MSNEYNAKDVVILLHHNTKAGNDYVQQVFLLIVC